MEKNKTGWGAAGTYLIGALQTLVPTDSQPTNKVLTIYRRVGSFVGMLAVPLLLASNAYALPSFSKTFTPGTIGSGAVSTLQFTITNPDPVPVRGLAFADNLPAAVTIAAATNASTDCPLGSVDAPVGGGTISFTDGGIGASSSCTISVDVTSNTPGTHTNVSGDLTSDAGNSGPATADLTVDAGRPGFRKAFAPGSVNFGARSTLVFTIDNSANSGAAYNLAFVDNLPSGMVVASPSNAATSCTNGIITAPPGGSSINYATQFGIDPAVAAGASCTVSVDIVANAIGTLSNTSGELTSTSTFNTFPTNSSGMASAILTVTTEQLALSKSFTNDPVAPGATVDLSFTVRNLDRRSTASNIGFSDDLGAVLPGLAAVGLPLADPCGPGSSLTGSSVISLSGGNLAAGATCSFTVTLQVPASTPSDTYTNVTSVVSGDLDGQTVTGNAANDLLAVVAAPVLSKQYLDDPVSAGGTTTLEFTLTNASPTDDATAISFSDEFATIITSAVSTPANGACGAGSIFSFTPRIDPVGSSAIPALFSVSNASLLPGESCRFILVLQIANDASPGVYSNVTSELTAVVDGASVAGASASDDLQVVAAPLLYKEFADDPVAPGDTVTLRYTLAHGEEAPGVATGIGFSDDLTAALSGMTAVGLPLTDVCGLGSEISGTANLVFSGGTLQPGASCSFDVTLQTPSTAASGDYPNTTSNVVATVVGLAVAGNQGSDTLHLYGLTFSKAFTDDPVLAGDTVTLEYSLANSDPSASTSNIAFSDDLDDALSGLIATGLPIADVCGPGSSLNGLAGDSLLMFQGGALAPGESCVFSVSLQVPAGTLDDQYLSTTSNLSADIAGITAVLGKASDVLLVSSNLLDFTKLFIDDPVPPGSSVDLQFTISNPTADTVTGLAFTDDLTAVLPGLVSSSGTLSDICAAGSQISGTDVLSFSGGTLAAGASCSFTLTLSVPADVQLGSVLSNTTSQLDGSIGGLAVFAAPATDDLRIDHLAFSKAFAGPAQVGGTTSLTFTLQNASTTETVSSIVFTDDLEAVLTGLVATGLPQADVCGQGSSLDGHSVLALADGTLLPGGSCTFTVDLQIPATALPGDYLNQTSEVQSGGVRVTGPASATLTVIADADADDDGVDNDMDYCPGTVIPESVPTKYLKHHRYALVDDDFRFDTGIKRRWPRNVFTTTDTAGCSCEQIIAAQNLGRGHKKYGCSLGAMREWVEVVRDVVKGDDDTDEHEGDKEEDKEDDDKDDKDKDDGDEGGKKDD